MLQRTVLIIALVAAGSLAACSSSNGQDEPGRLDRIDGPARVDEDVTVDQAG